MKKISKSTAIIAGAFVLGIAAGGGATYGILYKTGNLRIVSEKATPSEIRSPQKPDATLPENTISPTDLIKNFDQYKDKDIQVRGMLIQAGENNYLLVGQEKDQPGAIQADFSGSNIDVSKYVSNYTEKSTSEASLGSGLPVTVKAKVVSDNGRYKLKITEINQ